MFKIRSDPRLSNPNPIRVLIENSDPKNPTESDPIRLRNNFINPIRN
jgi:hypothetical protein